MEESIFDILECSVCLERLDETSRILPCQHTFCLRCLTTILKANEGLRCPECREPVPVREVKELPTNILLVRILGGLKRPPPGPPNLIEESTTPTSGSQQKSNSQVFKPTQPFARAKFNYEAKGEGDLSFNKGDIIFLKKKLDDHWYVGEVNQQMGFFPANHVDVLQPLVEDIPKCKALYDFEVPPTDERDILTFNKDEVLKVIRRVDDNWVEGQKGERIGIFPISFVEFNDPAKSLIDIQQQTQQGANDRANQSPQGSGSSGEGSSNTDQATGVVTRRQGGNRNKTTAKRHSFTSVLGVPIRQKDGQDRGNGSGRNSMEISSPELVRSSNPLAATILGARQQGGMPIPSTAVSATGTTHVTGIAGSRKRPPPLAGVPQVLLGGGSLPGSPSAVGTSTSPRPNVEVYQARYSYKPQNPDELEVTAGEIFTAYEIHADGWFKGMSLSTGKVGVFPGNYMEPYRVEDASRPGPSTHPAGPGQSAFPLLAPSALQSAKPRSTNSSLPVPSQSSGASSQPPGGRGTVSPPNTVLQQDCHKTVAQLQAEKLRQYQLLREMTNKASTSSGATSRDNPPAAGGMPVSRDQNSDASGVSTAPPGVPDLQARVPSIQLGEPSSRVVTPRPQSGHRSTNSNKRPSSSTGLPMSAFERTVHDTSGLLPPGNSARNCGYATRRGARGRSKSASRISSKTARGGNAGSSSPEEGDGSSSGNPGGTRSQVYRKHTNIPPVKQHMHEIPPRRFRPRCHSEGNLKQRTKETPSPSTVNLSPACSPSPTIAPSSHFTSIFSNPRDKRELKEKMRRKSSSDHPQQGPPPPIRTTPPLHSAMGGMDGAVGGGDASEERPPSTVPLVRERYHVIDSYPAQSDVELPLRIGDIIFVLSKREDGWFKGTSQRTGKTGLFPGIFVEKL